MTSERGGPVRVIVPEACGFKSIKWLSHLVLSNIPHANDTYAEKNNDVDSPLKTFAATLSVPKKVEADSPLTVTGYGSASQDLSKVQVWMHKEGTELPESDDYFAAAPLDGCGDSASAKSLGRRTARQSCFPADTWF
ncbi:MAG: molybdopterin-dependent oxidoreductase [Planctomycetaceae bacterium]